ncbi:MAG TPA: ABC-2 family transporter protein [Acidimicrobiales bacterium]|nr:ABC-2 family transporter protein [Acidimicrobiales bacterium]
MLGRCIRPYLATASMGATAGVGEHPVVLLDHAIALLRVALVVIIWKAILRSDAAPERPAPAAVLTYVLLARVLLDQLDVRTGVLGAIWEGTIATRLLRPVSFFGDQLAAMAGGWWLRWATFSLPAIVVASFLGVDLAPSTAGRGLAFLASLGLSIAVGAAVDFLFALLVIRWPESYWSLWFARDSLSPLVAGAVVPLVLLPWSIGTVLGWLPFAAMVSAPLRIYTGDGEVGALLASQAAWALVLWTVTRRLWRRAAVRMVSFGG